MFRPESAGNFPVAVVGGNQNCWDIIFARLKEAFHNRHISGIRNIYFGNILVHLDEFSHQSGAVPEYDTGHLFRFFNIFRYAGMLKMLYRAVT
jgi:hypothetical protein